MDTRTERSLEKVRNTEFPIIVTKELPRRKLKGWEEHFNKQGIAYSVVNVGENLYHLRRKVTEKEIEEIKDEKWFITGSGFRKVEIIR